MSDKAEFRAAREMLGLAQQNLADALGVDIRSVKRWERPGKVEPPAYAWDWMDNARQAQRDTVEQAVSAVLASAKPGGAVQLTYYRTQEQFDALGRDEGPVGMANANARLTAARLESLGYEVGWAYPDEPDNVYHGA